MYIIYIFYIYIYYIILYIYIYIYIYMPRAMGDWSKPSKSQTKWNGWQNMSKHKTPNSYTHSFPSTTKHLGNIRRLDYKQFLYFLLYVNSRKTFFMSKTKFNCFKKMYIFSYSLLRKILKLRRSILRLVFLIKVV